MGNRQVLVSLVGALASKLAPVGVQFCLLAYVTRQSGLEAGGLLALASASSFLCGSIGEAGFGTSLSQPAAYFGTPEPPVRGTRHARLSLAMASSALYVLLWTAGLGGHHATLLLLTPLPFMLAVSYGYAGALNAHGALKAEGIIVLAESASILLVVALCGTTLGLEPLSAALLGLVGGRAIGLMTRAVVLASLRTSALLTKRPLSVQTPFVLTTLATVLQGQADLLVLGFSGSLTLLGVYAPFLRIAYGFLLVAEGLSWGMYGAVGDEAERTDRPPARLVRRWRVHGIALGFGCAVLFLLIYKPVLSLVTGTAAEGLLGAAIIMAGAIVIRYVSFIEGVDLVRRGLQAQRLVPVLLAAALLAIGAYLADQHNSVTGLAASRLFSEMTIAVGYLVVLGRARTRRTALEVGS